METISLDGAHWQGPLDFYEALRSALRPNDGHGYGVDAFIDSMIYGGMLEIEPPYEVLVHNVGPADIRHAVEELSHFLAKARAERQADYGDDVNVSLRLVAD